MSVPAWKKNYAVWRQGFTRGEGYEFAALCKVCTAGKPGPWLCSVAGSAKEAWEICKAHEDAKHPKRKP